MNISTWRDTSNKFLKPCYLIKDDRRSEREIKQKRT